MITTCQEKNWGGLVWSEWIPLFSDISVYQRHICNTQGVYRIRASKKLGLVYIGQTGRDLRQRTRSLAINSQRDLIKPPWNDPHTAAPILWAYHHEDNFEFEISVASTNFDFATRQCYEDFLLYLHRIEHGQSTLGNHGRFHPSWTRPSNKSANRPMRKILPTKKYNSIDKVKKMGKFNTENWLGLEWSEFQPISQVNAPNIPGIYRIIKPNFMLYCGETKTLSKRINNHKKKEIFTDASISFHHMNNAEEHHLKEREVDMIGAYYEQTGLCPKYQYMGKNTSKSTRLTSHL